MILFPNGKINLGLKVKGKRTDGYHELETAFYPIPLRDAAEIVTSPRTSRKNDEESFQLTVTGMEIPGPPEDNLCRRAWELVRSKYPSIPPVKMFLHKAIPMGAGLGGGSSDAAFTLLLLNEELKLDMSAAELAALALELGSDCPFFLVNRPSLASGRGEILDELEPVLRHYVFILVTPSIHVGTAWAFARLAETRSSGEDKGSGNEDIRSILTSPVATWKNRLVNDFEVPVFAEYPVLQQIRDELYRLGAVYASLTGTGSCVFGIFDGNKHIDTSTLASKFNVFTLNKTC